MQPPNHIQANVSGATLNPLQVGGSVAFLLTTTDPKTITAAQAWATEAGLVMAVAAKPVLVADQGFSGLLIAPPIALAAQPVWLPASPPSGHTVAENIRQAGLVGQTLGGFTIPDEHPDQIVKTGAGNADQAVQLLSKVKQHVRDRLGVQLRENLDYIGF